MFLLTTGVGIALAHISAVALISEYFEKRKALALAVQSVTSGLSALIFSPLMVHAFTYFGYAETFLLFGGVFLHMYIAVALFRPLPKSNASTNDVAPVVEKKASACLGCGSVCVSMRSPVFFAFFFLLFSVTAGRAVTSSFLPALALEFGTTLTEAAFLPAISGLTAAAGSLIIGASFEMKLIRKCRIYLYSVNAFIIGATMLWMPFTTSFWSLAIPTAINGVSSSVIFAQQMTVLTDLLGKKHAVAGLGVIRIALALGSIFGRSISAIFIDTMGTNKIGFYLTSCLPMLGTLLFIAVMLVHSRMSRTEASSDTLRESA